MLPVITHQRNISLLSAKQRDAKSKQRSKVARKMHRKTRNIQFHLQYKFSDLKNIVFTRFFLNFVLRLKEFCYPYDHQWSCNRVQEFFHINNFVRKIFHLKVTLFFQIKLEMNRRTWRRSNSPA